MFGPALPVLLAAASLLARIRAGAFLTTTHGDETACDESVEDNQVLAVLTVYATRELKYPFTLHYIIEELRRAVNFSQKYYLTNRKNALGQSKRLCLTWDSAYVHRIFGNPPKGRLLKNPWYGNMSGCVNCQIVIPASVGPLVESAALATQLLDPNVISATTMGFSYPRRRLGRPRSNEPIGCPRCFNLLPGNNNMARIVFDILKRFEWHRAAFLFPEELEKYARVKDKYVFFNQCLEIFKDTGEIARANNYKLKMSNSALNEPLNKNIKRTLLDGNFVGAEYGVIFICGFPNFTDMVLDVALEAGFMDRGEYVFIDVLIARDNLNIVYPWEKYVITNYTNYLDRQAHLEKYGNFMHVTYDPRSYSKRKGNLEGWSWYAQESANFVCAFALFWSQYDLEIERRTEKYNGHDLQFGAWFHQIAGDFFYFTPTHNGSESGTHPLKTKTVTTHEDESTTMVTSNGDVVDDLVLMAYDRFEDEFRVSIRFKMLPVLRDDQHPFRRQLVNSSIPFSLWKSRGFFNHLSKWPPDRPVCGIGDANCPAWKYCLTTILVVFFVFVVVLSIFRERGQRKKIVWVIPSNALKKVNFWPRSKSAKSTQRDLGLDLFERQTWSMSVNASPQPEGEGDFVATAVYNNVKVALKERPKLKKSMEIVKLKDIAQVKEFSSDFIVPFVGVFVEHSPYFIITEYCPRGSIWDALNNASYEPDSDFRLSMSLDVAKALNYLHNYVKTPHGKLRSTNCLINSRFLVRLSGFAPHQLETPWWDPADLDDQDWTHSKEKKSGKKLVAKRYDKRLLWVAPELLRVRHVRPVPFPKGTFEGDVYSYGIILHELFQQEETYYSGSYSEVTDEQKIKKIEEPTDPVFRPVFNKLVNVPNKVRLIMNLAEQCWAERPEIRPSIKKVLDVVGRVDVFGCTKNSLLDRLKHYNAALEEQIKVQTEDIRKEQNKMEFLLNEMLPENVANLLLESRPVPSVTFDNVSILYAKIYNITPLTSSIPTDRLVPMLNKLFGDFDTVVSFFSKRLYKMETIGDMYIVSTRPMDLRLSENPHAYLALLALFMRKVVKDFDWVRFSDQEIPMRFGIHSGTVVAGLLGSVVPKYTYIGETMNLASRMESTGEAMMIQISEETKEKIKDDPRLEIQPRGLVHVKGIGSRFTYWLDYRHSALKESPVSSKGNSCSNGLPLIVDKMFQELVEDKRFDMFNNPTSDIFLDEIDEEVDTVDDEEVFLNDKNSGPKSVFSLKKRTLEAVFPQLESN